MQIAASLIIVSAVRGASLGAATAQDSTGRQTREEIRTRRDTREREVEVHRARLRYIEHLRRTEALHAAALASERRHVGFEEISVGMIGRRSQDCCRRRRHHHPRHDGREPARIAPGEHGKETVVLDCRGRGDRQWLESLGARGTSYFLITSSVVTATRRYSS